jgi:hypothetical protein
MSAESAILDGRAAAESLMVDSCRVRRVTGTTTLPDGTTETAYEDVYAGKCRIQTNDPYESRPEAGEHSFTVLRDILQVPMSVVGVRVDDVVDSVVSALDPDLAGRTWRVAGPSRKTHQTMRRFYIAEVAG